MTSVFNFNEQFCTILKDVIFKQERIIIVSLKLFMNVRALICDLKKWKILFRSQNICNFLFYYVTTNVICFHCKIVAL